MSAEPQDVHTGKALDRCYIRYWSVWLDLALLIEAISKSAGKYPGGAQRFGLHPAGRRINGIM